MKPSAHALKLDTDS